MPGFPRVGRSTLRRVGRLIIGSRSRNFLLRCFPAGTGISDRRSSPDGVRTTMDCPWRTIKILQRGAEKSGWAYGWKLNSSLVVVSALAGASVQFFIVYSTAVLSYV